MNSSTATGQRVTALVSTLVAIGLLAAAVTARPSRTPPRDELTRLESDLKFQLEMAFRHDTQQRAERLEQLQRAVQAWQQSPQTDEDRRLFASWLREAIVRSLPGSIDSLPAIPPFGQPAPPVDQTPSLAETESVVIQPADVEASAPATAELSSNTQIQPPTDNTLSLRSEEPSPSSPTVKTLVAVQPASSTRTTVERPRARVAKTVSTSLAQPTMARTEKPIPINLTELNARIAGYHKGLDEVEAALLALDRPNLSELADLVGQLDALANNFRFVKLYYDVLTEAERQTVSSPRSLDAVLAEVQRQLDRRESASDGDFLGPFDARQHERIAQLRQQLTEIASRIAW